MSEIAALGEVIAERYRIEGVLGRGGMGAVYEAQQLGLNRRVAIKLMHPEVGANDDFRARFAREARVSAALQHPGAVKVFDFGEDRGRLFIVMERLEGQPLRALVDEKTLLPLPRTIDVARQVAEVLITAHELPLVHRDLKPENVFLERKQDGSDRVVIVDFGLAFIDQREDVARMTQAGMLMGTPAYISPEQISGASVGPPADMYSYGCMLYELVTGDTPFEGPPMMQLPKHLFEAPMPPSRRRTDNYIPRALEGFILSLLAKRAEDRPNAKAAFELMTQLMSTLGERERARGREALDGRAARMIPTVRPLHQDTPFVQHRFVQDELVQHEAIEVDELPAAAPSDIPADASVVAVVGELGEDVALGLRANGLYTAPAPGHLPPGASVIYAPGADRELLQRLLQLGLPVLTDVDAADAGAVSVLMAMGVADVLTRPVRVEQLAKKLARALRKSQRRRDA